MKHQDEDPKADNLGSPSLTDKERLRRIFEKYYPRLRFFLTEFGHDEEKAGELAQNLFVAFWEELPRLSFKNEGDLKEYLYVQAKNKVVGMASKGKIDLAKTLTETIASVHGALKILPTKYKATFNLAVEGKTPAEIAEVLRKSQQEVRDNIDEGLKILEKECDTEDIMHIMILLDTRDRFKSFGDTFRIQTDCTL